MTAPELCRHLQNILSDSGIEDTRFEAMCIAEYVSGKPLSRLLMERNGLSPDLVKAAEMIAARRTGGEPLQYILGKWEFYGMPFYVGRGVLIPRQDTETLVEYALKQAVKRDFLSFIDLCSGSGCIAAAVANRIPCAEVTAVELSEKAAEYFKRNMKLNELDVRLVIGDALSEETAKTVGKAQMILCNPPYLSAWDMENLQREVRYEPREALFGGEDGLYFYRSITRIWKENLQPGGILAFEIGMGQENAVSEIFRQNGFDNITLRNDLSGIVRVVSASKI